MRICCQGIEAQRLGDYEAERKREERDSEIAIVCSSARHRFDGLLRVRDMKKGPCSVAGDRAPF